MSRKHVADYGRLKHIRELKRDGKYLHLPKGEVMPLDTYRPPEGRPRSMPPAMLTGLPCAEAPVAPPPAPPAEPVAKPYHSPGWYESRRSMQTRENISQGLRESAVRQERAARKHAAMMNATQPHPGGAWMTVRQIAQSRSITAEGVRHLAAKGGWDKMHIEGNRKPLYLVPAAPGAVTYVSESVPPSFLRRLWTAIAGWVHS